MQMQLLSISFENFKRGEWLYKVIVQIATVRTLLYIAVLREILHAHTYVYDRFPTMLAVQPGLCRQRVVVHLKQNFSFIYIENYKVHNL